SFRFSPSPMAASLSTLRANRVGGGLLSGVGVTNSLTITLNCRSRSARLRGAAGSAETRRLAVASDVPSQALGGMPPVAGVRYPVGKSSNCFWASAGTAPAVIAQVAKPAARLVRKAFTGHRHLEMLHRRARLEQHQRRDPEGDDANHQEDQERPPSEGRNLGSGTEEGHAAQTTRPLQRRQSWRQSPPAARLNQAAE